MAAETIRKDNALAMKSPLKSFVDLVRRQWMPSKRLDMTADAKGRASLEWAHKGVYPDASAADMAPLARLGVKALEFLPRMELGVQQGYWGIAHLADGRRFRLALNNLSRNRAVVSAARQMDARAGSASATTSFFNWACHEKAVFAQKPGAQGDWRLARRRANVKIGEDSEADWLVHPQKEGPFEDAPSRHFTFTREAMAPWWLVVSEKLAAQLTPRLDPRERKKINQIGAGDVLAFSAPADGEDEATTTHSQKRDFSANLDAKIAAAFPESMASEIKAFFERKVLRAEMSATSEQIDPEARPAPKRTAARL